VTFLCRLWRLIPVSACSMQTIRVSILHYPRTRTARIEMDQKWLVRMTHIISLLALIAVPNNCFFPRKDYIVITLITLVRFALWSVILCVFFKAGPEMPTEDTARAARRRPAMVDRQPGATVTRKMACHTTTMVCSSTKRSCQSAVFVMDTSGSLEWRAMPVSTSANSSARRNSSVEYNE